MSELITVEVNGKQYATFQRLNIRKSLDDICHSLEMDVSANVVWNIHKHDILKVRCTLDGVEQLLTTVEVDDIERLLNAQGKSYRIMGRSQARNLIDSSYSGQLRQLTLSQLCQRICKDFQIPFKSWVAKTDLIESFEWENESVWQKLLSQVVAQQCLLYSSQSGGLYLNRVSGRARPEGFVLQQTQNIEEVNKREAGRDQYQNYLVIGENGKGRARDATCSRPRTLTLNMSDSTMSEQDLQRWATVQMQRRRGVELQVKLPGWGLDRQKLEVVKRRAAASDMTGDKKKKLWGFEIFWGVNFYTMVDLPDYGFEKKYLLTTAVEYSVESDKISCNVTLKDRENYLAK